MYVTSPRRKNKISSILVLNESSGSLVSKMVLFDTFLLFSIIYFMCILLILGYFVSALPTTRTAEADCCCCCCGAVGDSRVTLPGERGCSCDDEMLRDKSRDTCDNLLFNKLKQ